MPDKFEACAECSRMCHVMHQRNRDSSCAVTSFFKIMFRTDYNDFLFLPPKFASSMPFLIGQEAKLEDSSGEQWTVKVSKIEDSLAFEEGWSAFSKDHRLKVGEILVFHYIYESRLFFVQIFGASGCPKNKRVESNRSNKRARTEGDFGDEDRDCHMNDNELGSNGSMGSRSFNITERQPESTSNNIDLDEHHQGMGSRAFNINERQPESTSNNVDINEYREGSTGNIVDIDTEIRRVPVVSETRQYAEPFCMIERDDGYIVEENRSCLYDLSKYEVSVGTEKSSQCGRTVLESPIGEDMLINNSLNRSGDLFKTLIEKRVENREKSMALTKEEAIFHEAEKPTAHQVGSEKYSHQGSAENGKSLHQAKSFMKSSPTEAGMFDNKSVNLSHHALRRFATKTTESSLQMFKKETHQIAKEKGPAHLAETKKVTKIETAKTCDMPFLKGILHGTEENGIKEGFHSFTRAIKAEDLTYEMVKEEPIDYDDTPLQDSGAAASCLVVIGSENYVEMPEDFPSIASSRGRKLDRRVVFLWGPNTRTKPWPVIYIEKCGLKILSGGWEMFRKHNGIRPGDECLFQREDNPHDCLFKLSIVNRQVNGM